MYVRIIICTYVCILCMYIHVHIIKYMTVDFYTSKWLKLTSFCINLLIIITNDSIINIFKSAMSLHIRKWLCMRDPGSLEPISKSTEMNSLSTLSTHSQEMTIYIVHVVHMPWGHQTTYTYMYNYTCCNIKCIEFNEFFFKVCIQWETQFFSPKSLRYKINTLVWR